MYQNTEYFRLEIPLLKLSCIIRVPFAKLLILFVIAFTIIKFQMSAFYFQS